MAIEDAVVLARAMARLTDPERAFEAFTSERCKRTAAITNEPWKFGKIGHWEGQLACRLRDAAFGLVMPLVGTRNLMKFTEYDTGLLPAHSRHPLISTDADSQRAQAVGASVVSGSSRTRGGS